MVLDGPMTGEWFAAYTQQVLAPTLRPGDIVILDNLPAPKVAAAREAIEAVVLTGINSMKRSSARTSWASSDGLPG